MRGPRGVIVLVVMLALSCSPSAAEGPWRWANPLPHGNPLRAVTACGGTWVAVGDYGTVYRSTDGATWLPQASGTTEYLNNVACSSSLFVAVGNNGLVLTSPDGATWTAGTTGYGDSLLDVGWDPPGTGFAGQFVAVGMNNIILLSPNGQAWTVGSPPDGSGDHLWGVAVALDQPRVVVTGGHCDSSVCEVSNMGASTDHGLTWEGTSHTVQPWGGILNGVTWGTSMGPLFVAVHDDGSALISPDGLVWTPYATGGTGLVAVASSGTRFVACAFDGTIWSSENATVWSPETSPTTLSLLDVTWGGDRFAIVGHAGTLLTSPWGDDWTAQMSPSGNASTTFKDAVWSGTLFVVVSHVTADYAVSGDGWSWEFRDGSSGISPSPANGVAWGGGMFVAVGNGGRIVTSPDGDTWTERTPPAATLLRGAAWSGSDFVAVGNNGAIFSSPDGVVWAPESSGTSARLYGVACGGATCVAVGDQVITTRTGGVWSAQTRTEALLAVAHGAGRFTAVGSAGAVLTSADGAVWQVQGSGTTLVLRDVVFGDGRFVAAGSSGIIVESADGTTWSQVRSGTANSLYGLSAGRVLAVGVSGAILHRAVFFDGFETGGTGAWSNTVP